MSHDWQSRSAWCRRLRVHATSWTDSRTSSTRPPIVRESDVRKCLLSRANTSLSLRASNAPTHLDASNRHRIRQLQIWFILYHFISPNILFSLLKTLKISNLINYFYLINVWLKTKLKKFSIICIRLKQFITER